MLSEREETQRQSVLFEVFKSEHDYVSDLRGRTRCEKHLTLHCVINEFVPGLHHPP